MTFNEFQKKAQKTAIYPQVGNNLIYPTLGFVGEAGELADKVKKVYRDDRGVISPEVREGIINEIGDVLWYAAMLCSELKIKMSMVAGKNLTKLASRKKRRKIKGSGDDR